LKPSRAMDAGQLGLRRDRAGAIRERLGRDDARNGSCRRLSSQHAKPDALNVMLKSLGQPIDAVLLMRWRRETLMRAWRGERTCRSAVRFTMFTFHLPPWKASAMSVRSSSPVLAPGR